MRKGKEARNPRPRSRPSKSQGTAFVAEAQSWMAKWPHWGSFWRGLLAHRPHQITSPILINHHCGRDREGLELRAADRPSLKVPPKCEILIIVQLVEQSATENSYRVKPWGSRARSSQGDHDAQMTVMELTHFTSLSLGFFHCKLRGPFLSSRNFPESSKFYTSMVLWFNIHETEPT